MARLVIYCPLLDLELATGEQLPPALAVKGTPLEKEAQLAAMRRETGEAIANELRDSLQLLAMLQPGFRALVQQGLYVLFEDTATAQLPVSLQQLPEHERDAAQVEAPKGKMKCASCGDPATGFKIVYECLDCSQKGKPSPILKA